MLKIEFYQPFFNVSNEDVKNRLMMSFIPRPRFFEIARDNPDLWGPVWITSTMVFMLSAAGNFSNYLSANDKDQYLYNYEFVPAAAGLVYGVGFGLPILLGLVMKCFGTDITIF